jgi:hypothetical protein
LKPLSLVLSMTSPLRGLGAAVQHQHQRALAGQVGWVDGQ